MYSFRIAQIRDRSLRLDAKAFRMAAGTKIQGFDARAVANHLLDLASTRGVRLSNLHLQKVIYFAHGIYLRERGCQLVVNRFEAWEHGPVISELYHALKEYGDGCITGRATRFDFAEKKFVEVRDDFAESVSQFLAEILMSYGRMDPWDLVKISHDPSGAWAKTMDAAERRANFALVISPDLIATCFSASPSDKIQ